MAQKKKTKNKKPKNSQNKKVDNVKTNYQQESSKIIKCLVIVLVIFGLMYLLTMLILKNSSNDIYKKQREVTTIQYDEILLGTVFNKKDKEYLVLFYNIDDDTQNTYGDLLSDYEAKDESLPIYYVDLGNGMNKSCIADEANKEATNASELKINDATLIKFSNKKIEEYIVGKDDITDYLNK